MGREASLIWVSPTLKRLKPPPVPDTPTFTWTLGCTFLNSSATASVIGNTVLDPSISIVPAKSFVAGVGVDSVPRLGSLSRLGGHPGCRGAFGAAARDGQQQRQGRRRQQEAARHCARGQIPIP